MQSCLACVDTYGSTIRDDDLHCIQKRSVFLFSKIFSVFLISLRLFLARLGKNISEILSAN